MPNSKKKKQDFFGEEGLFANAVLIACGISFLLFLIFLGLVAIYSEKDWLLHQAFQSYMFAFIMFAISGAFIFPYESKRIIDIIVRVIVGIFIIFASVNTFFNGTLLLMDKEAYDTKQYEIVVGYPEDPEFYTTKGQPSRVDNIYVNDIIIDAGKIGLTGKEYNEQWEGKEIRFYYLPHSKMVMKWEYAF